MRVNASAFVLCTVVEGEQIKRLSYRVSLLWIERVLKPTLRTAERVLGLRDLLAHHVPRQFVVLDKPHASSLPRESAA